MTASRVGPADGDGERRAERAVDTRRRGAGATVRADRRVAPRSRTRSRWWPAGDWTEIPGWGRAGWSGRRVAPPAARAIPVPPTATPPKTATAAPVLCSLRTNA